jgi:hypothetical protein
MHEHDWIGEVERYAIRATAFLLLIRELYTIVRNSFG